MDWGNLTIKVEILSETFILNFHLLSLLAYSFCINRGIDLCVDEICRKKSKSSKTWRKNVKCGDIFSDSHGNAKLMINFFSPYLNLKQTWTKYSSIEI